MGAAPTAAAGEGGVSADDLEVRREALRVQVEQVEAELATCCQSTAELSRTIEEKQHQMGGAVDELETLTRSVAEAQARRAELMREHERLEAAAALVRMRAGDAERDEAEDEEESKLAALARQRSIQGAAKKLALHRSHLLRLEEENLELRRKLEVASQGNS